MHPVAEVLRARAAGRRDDAHRVALVLEGGGMRGVVSAGMTAGLERLGMGGAFDLVAGASAGALNGAAFLAGVAAGSAAAYHGTLATRDFVNPARLLRGRPALDVGWVVRNAHEGLDAARHERTLSSGIPLHCLAVDVETAEPVDLVGMRNVDELCGALLASSRMPWVGGAPVELAGRRYLDGGLAAPIPVATALGAGATHVLVLQTRPHGVPRSSGSRLADRLIVRHLKRLNPELVKLYHGRVASYEAVVEDIARRSEQPEPPYVLGLRLPAGTPPVGQLERRPEVLRTAAEQAEKLVDEVLS
jgi:predicted patatin/cPLA2 family phospholipase